MSRGWVFMFPELHEGRYAEFRGGVMRHASLVSSLRIIQESLARTHVAERYFKRLAHRTSQSSPSYKSPAKRRPSAAQLAVKTRSEPQQCDHPFWIVALSNLQVRCLLCP